MKTSKSKTSYNSLLLLILLGLACTTPDNTIQSDDNANSVLSTSDSDDTSGSSNQEPDLDLQIIAHVSCITEDAKGQLWIGTLDNGALRYDGQDYEWLAKSDFPALVVRAIATDKQGNIWFGSDAGLIRYDGDSYKVYTKQEGLLDNNIYSLSIDKNNKIWIGTIEGVCTYDGVTFTRFDLPEATPDTTRIVSGSRMVYSIMIDSQDKVWFGTDGGAYYYNGVELSNLSTKDGLCDNSVNRITESSQGGYYFATQKGGVCYWDGQGFRTISELATDGELVTSWDVYEDTAGRVWFPIYNKNTYYYKGEAQLTPFPKKNCLGHTILCSYEDQKGQLWFGGWSGLYTYSENKNGLSIP